MAVYARISIIGMDKFKELYSDTFGFYPKMSYVYIGKDTTSTDVTKSATAVGVDKTFFGTSTVMFDLSITGRNNKTVTSEDFSIYPFQIGYYNDSNSTTSYLSIVDQKADMRNLFTSTNPNGIALAGNHIGVKFDIDALSSYTTKGNIPSNDICVSLYLAPRDYYSTATKHTVTYDLEGCTCNKTETSFTENDSVTFVLTASKDTNNKDTFFVRDAPKATVGGVEHSFTISDDKKQASLTVSITGDVTITASTGTYPYVCTKHLTHCSTTLPDSFTSGVQNFKVVADDGYHFEMAEHLGKNVVDGVYWYVLNKDDYDNNVIPDVLSYSSQLDSTGKNVTFSTSDFDTKSSPWYFVLVGKAVVNVTTCSGLFNLVGCSSNVSAGTFNLNSDLSVTLTANDGTSFDEVPTFSMGGNLSEFTVSADKKTATINITLTGDFIVSGTTASVQPTLASDFVTIYLPTSQDLHDIANYTWHIPVNSYVKDCITELFQTFISVPSTANKKVTIAGETSTIECGYSKVIDVEVESNEVVFDEESKNFLDYEPYQKVEIYLPFIGFQKLDTDRVIGHTIKIVYVCNLYTTDCTCYIYSDNVMFKAFTGKCGFDYPFRENGKVKVNVSSCNYYKDLKPKVYLFRTGVLANDASQKSVCFISELGNLHGYVCVDELLPDSVSFDSSPAITKSEFDTLTQLLKSGVYFD